jgi:hypothetical protein
MTWTISVERVNNGFVCKIPDEDEEGETIIKSDVFQDNPDSQEEDDLDNMVKLLCFIKDYFGVNYSKHNKRNIVINIEEKKDEN